MRSVDYVNLEDGAARLGLRLERSVPTTAVMLKYGAQPVARLADHSRETDLKGLRVFLGDPVIDARRRVLRQQDRLPGAAPAPPAARPYREPPGRAACDRDRPRPRGPDHGSENKSLGTMEKTYTLDVSLRLRKLLEASGYKVVMTRDSDLDLSKPDPRGDRQPCGRGLLRERPFQRCPAYTKTTGVEVLLVSRRIPRVRGLLEPGPEGRLEAKDSPVNRFDAGTASSSGPP